MSRRDLPTDDTIVHLYANGAGCSDPLMGSWPASVVRHRMSEIMGAKALGRVNATMPGMVLKELQAADVKALSFSRGQAWDDLLEDLLLWHVSREVCAWLHGRYIPLRYIPIDCGASDRLPYFTLLQLTSSIYVGLSLNVPYIYIYIYINIYG